MVKGFRQGHGTITDRDANTCTHSNPARKYSKCGFLDVSAGFDTHTY